ncbi:MAG: hypothetical protein ACXWFZ_11945 [Nitrososphaeraceae archaeon]
MSTVKKWLLVFVVILTIASVVFMSGCGDSDMVMLLAKERDVVKTSETAPATKETVAEAKVKGTIYETELFSILVPDGWVTEGLSAEDLFPEESAEGSVGVMITKDKDAMMLAVLLDIPDAATFSKEQVKGNIELLNGTALGEVTMLGIKFFGESHTSDGDYQTVYYGDRNGDVVVISMVGKDHENNVEIKAMLDSIKFK